MSITTSRDGRNLLIHVEGIDDPFVAKPLPGRAGVQITETFLHTSVGAADIPDLEAAMIMAVDGGTLNPDTGLWEPVPVEQQTTYSRVLNELSQAEAESVLMPAFFWQTALGSDGVKAYVEGGEGLAGTLRATQALTARVTALATPTAGGVADV